MWRLAVGLIGAISIALAMPAGSHPVAGAPQMTPGETMTAIAGADADSYAPGAVLVRYRRGVRSVGEVAQWRAQGARTVASEMDLYLISVVPGTERAVAEALRQDPGVAYSSVDSYLELAAAFPSDPAYTTTDPDEREYYRFLLAKTQTPEVWDLAFGVRTTTVAVIDTGIDIDHPDFSGRVVSGANYVMGEENRNEQDLQGHGTGAAGVIGSTANNGQYAAGINQQTKLMGIKAFNDQGIGRVSEVIGAIRHAGNANVTLVNMSYVYTRTPQEQSEIDAITDAMNQYLISKGILVVASAGNFGPASSRPDRQNEPLLPGSLNGVIAVGATELNIADLNNVVEQISDRSSRGSWVSLTAPGKYVRVLWRRNCEQDCNKEVQQGYATKTGTSFAAPVVAGTASIIKGCFPTLSASQIKGVMQNSADKIGTTPYTNGRNDVYGYGRVNVYKALQAAESLARSQAALGVRSPASTATPSPVARIFVPSSPRHGTYASLGC